MIRTNELEPGDLVRFASGRLGRIVCGYTPVGQLPAVVFGHKNWREVIPVYTATIVSVRNAEGGWNRVTHNETERLFIERMGTPISTETLRIEELALDARLHALNEELYSTDDEKRIAFINKETEEVLAGLSRVRLALRRGTPRVTTPEYRRGFWEAVASLTALKTIAERDIRCESFFEMAKRVYFPSDYAEGVLAAVRLYDSTKVLPEI